jgi:hydrogenase maturation protein HypF
MAGRSNQKRARFEFRGRVQGVGFRPHVYRVASNLGLSGFVSNTSDGALIEAEGAAGEVDLFLQIVLETMPPLASVTAVDLCELPAMGKGGFAIRPSCGGQPRCDVTPDAAMCPACLGELFNPHDPRHRYPFINCTNCGPRYSIIESVPYDRPSTTMRAFEMCETCAAQYADPADRRFHAQPVACPDCGPHVWLEGTDGRKAAKRGEAIARAAELLNQGRIVAIKGIGGFHLACLADCEDAVRQLRQRKLRDGKPLAIMAPTLQAAARLVHLNGAAREALYSLAAPIVLAPRRDDAPVAPGIAPGCRDLGVMLPYAPLHYLLFVEGLGPLAMTSANLSGQPLTYLNQDARRTLADVADALLMHNRDIHRPIDDSVVISLRGRCVPIRRARGYVPVPIPVGDEPVHVDVMALGGDLKNTICLLRPDGAVLSEHLGDLGNADAYRNFVAAEHRLRRLFDFEPAVVAHDLHPAFESTRYARTMGKPLIAVQHHHAHIASVTAEHDEPGPVIGIACDGTGYGTDGAVWGCEILLCERGDFERIGQLVYVPLVGGDAASIECWRPAMAWLRQAWGADWREIVSSQCPQIGARLSAAAGVEQIKLAERMIDRGLNTPPTSSLGRLLDATAFLLGLCDRNRHEAEAAMALETAAASYDGEVAPLQFEIHEHRATVEISLAPMVREFASLFEAGCGAVQLAARVHETIVAALWAAALRVRDQRGVNTVVLSGGCFVNRLLTERLTDRLEDHGFRVLTNQAVPPGDGGISLGQAWVARWRVAERNMPKIAQTRAKSAEPMNQEAC